MWSQLWPGDTQPRRLAAEFLNLHIFIVHFWGVSIWLWNVSPQASEVSMITKIRGCLGTLVMGVYQGGGYSSSGYRSPWYLDCIPESNSLMNIL